jgi:hypothetical protein
VRVAAIEIGGSPGTWRELGFVPDGDAVVLGPVRLELNPSVKPGTIAAWALEGSDLPDLIDGLPTRPGKRGGTESKHPNGAMSIDHLVVLTPSLERTTAAFGDLGIERRRVREAGNGIRQGFFFVGDLLVEVVEGGDLPPSDPAAFWGLTAVVDDIDAAARLLGDKLAPVKQAVQPGRRIATVRAEASNGLPLALISPR